MPSLPDMQPEATPSPRESELAETPPGKYRIVYADPPWRYDFSKSDSRSIEAHYPTMSTDEICDLDVPSADVSILYLWATAPKLPDALRVVDAWGFEYKTNMVWVKKSIGMGYHARGRHELLLIATRGGFPPPEPSMRPDSVISFPKTVHSRKPYQVAEMIERLWPSLPKLEMFCRRPREGWDGWGNQYREAPDLLSKR